MIVENNDAKPIRGLQNMLRNISYYVDDVKSVIPDGNFTEDTKNSVVSFQKNYGLEPNGEVDNVTWQKIRDVNNEINRLNPNPSCFSVFGKKFIINSGDEMPELLVIQAMLKTIFTFFDNSPVIEITGIHDDNSVQSVIFVQNLSGLEPTGIIDVLTYNNIADLYTSNVAKKTNIQSEIL